MRTDDGRDFLRNCAYCGRELPEGREYPVDVASNDDGEPAVYAFCDDGCLSGWKADTGDPSDTGE